MIFYHVVPYTRVTQFDMSVIGSFHLNHWLSLQRGESSSKLRFEYVYLEDCSQQNGPYLKYIIPTNNAGTVSGDVEPNNVAIYLRWITENQRDCGRGHSSVPGVLVSFLKDVGKLKSHQRAAIKSGWEFLIRLSNPAYSLVMVSKFYDNQPRLFGLVSKVTGVQVGLYTTTAQRRLIK
jgi:hypothetical protein